MRKGHILETILRTNQTKTRVHRFFPPLHLLRSLLISSVFSGLRSPLRSTDRPRRKRPTDPASRGRVAYFSCHLSGASRQPVFGERVSSSNRSCKNRGTRRCCCPRDEPKLKSTCWKEDERSTSSKQHRGTPHTPQQTNQNKPAHSLIDSDCHRMSHPSFIA